ncbi:Leucine-rich repeat-containing protein 47 [Portunus trituberculatus]|uniref:Leucine-rich repeat-containing protein 47 n=1 Tax=Portunus trituberculatus TaxID=210409 RepID=A0A5B7JIW5_PORTR|nr:Leucine-rich repeat-containing protein 47 [Portunus trituberculatus]
MVATVATHDLSKVHAPLYYTAHAPKEMHIHPLGRGKEISAWELYGSLQHEAEAQRKQQKRNVAGLHRMM